MSTLIKPHEVAWLKMKAYAAFNKAKIAAAAGETYTAAKNETVLESGHTVSLVVQLVDGWLQPIAHIDLDSKKIKGACNPIAMEIARALLGNAAVVHESYLGMDKYFSVPRPSDGKEADAVPRN